MAHGVAGLAFHQGMNPGVLLDDQPVAKQTPLLKKVLDNIPDEIHPFMDRRSTVGAVI